MFSKSYNSISKKTEDDEVNEMFKAKRKYFVSEKTLKYLVKEGYRKRIRDNAKRELQRRKLEKKLR